MEMKMLNNLIFINMAFLSFAIIAFGQSTQKPNQAEAAIHELEKAEAKKEQVPMAKTNEVKQVERKPAENKPEAKTEVAVGVGPVASPSPTPATAPVKKDFMPISDVDITHLKDPAQFFWGIDPFLRQPGFAKINEKEESPLDRLHLEAIIYEPKNPIAVINGKNVSQGDRFDDFIIETISKNSVVVRGDGFLSEIGFSSEKEAATSDIEASVMKKAGMK